MAAKSPAPRRKKRVLALCVILGLLLALAAAFFLYVGVYSHAEDAVWDLAVSYDVTIEQEDGYIAIKPAQGVPATGYVFYPGGKVEHTAYLPYLAQVAEQGYFCVLLEMPFRLAVLDGDAAAGPMAAHPEISAWAVGGHSLGGVAAASFAAKDDPPVQGLVLLASYPTADLSQSGLAVMSITATGDEVLNWEKYEEALPNLPGDTEYVSIQGGNHGQFGMYGAQSGDGAAAISPEEQRGQAAVATVRLLAEL